MSSEYKACRPQPKGCNHVCFLFLFFIFFFGGGVTSSKKSLGAGITDPAEKLKKTYMIIYLMTYCFFIVSNFLMTWCCLFIFYGCWFATFSLHDLFPIFDSMIPLIIYCFFFQLNCFFQFSVAAGAEIILTHLVTERIFFYVFSFFVPFCFVFHVWWRYKPHPPWSDRCKNCGAATNTFSRLQIVFLPDWTENAFRQKLFGIKKMWSISVQNDNN